MNKTVGVIRFLGTNCDQDVFSAIKQAGLSPEWVCHQDQFDKSQYMALFLPGGFSHGDYLRCGALAARAPVMKSVVEASRHGTPILGICNGFQILCEANLLPGVLVRNNSLRFRDGWVGLQRVQQSPQFGSDKLIYAKLPIAHGEGRYYIEDDQVKKLFDDEQVWCVYERNPNGSVENIAGVMNENKNVAGLMPHPERAVADFMGGSDGLSFFTSLL
ncbi:MAG: phosphoribosylformylglycinamidine synthase I [Bdellovibrionales bacterium RBG_16_40_8]|nr:MAG: phosphoribosylformylglycinamidine synthase I [Bdellovibrionales bacterium RBG_16_40_8]